jgi:4-alpha-glucanotransferase
LISLEDLVTDGLLDRSALKDAPANDARVDYQAQSDFRTPLLNEVADRFIANSPDLIDQHSHQHPELLKAAWFAYLAARERSADWSRWDEAELRDDPPQGVQRFLAVQLLAHRQWQSLRAHARKRGIVLLGDMPIGVDRESADVWQYPNLFALREDGGTAWQAGVPPDAFSDDGQCWQMPCFSWDDHASSAFSWWRQRV